MNWQGHHFEAGGNIINGSLSPLIDFANFVICFKIVILYTDRNCNFFYLVFFVVCLASWDEKLNFSGGVEGVRKPWCNFMTPGNTRVY